MSKEDEEKLQTIFEGLIDYFFDPDNDDETYPCVLLLIQNSKRSKRLKRKLLPPDTLSALCSSGWNYKDYAASIKAAIENWETKAEIKEYEHNGREYFS